MIISIHTVKKKKQQLTKFNNLSQHRTLKLGIEGKFFSVIKVTCEKPRAMMTAYKFPP